MGFLRLSGVHPIPYWRRVLYDKEEDEYDEDIADVVVVDVDDVGSVSTEGP